MRQKKRLFEVTVQASGHPSQKMFIVKEVFIFENIDFNPVYDGYVARKVTKREMHTWLAPHLSYALYHFGWGIESIKKIIEVV